MEETAFCSTAYGRNGVLLIRRGLEYRKTEETDFCWSAYGRNRVLFIHRLLPRSSLHGLLFIHRRPPPASTSYCSSSLHRLLFIEPPRGPVHPPVTGWGAAASSGSCSSSGNGLLPRA